jgi:glutathione S-transferase
LKLRGARSLYSGLQIITEEEFLMAEYVTIAEARQLTGMRLIVAEKIPGPWAEGIRGVLDVKGIPYARGRFDMASDHSDLIAWTAQASVPVIAWNDEFPKSNWMEQIYLADRIAPEPSVIPANITDRMRMFGLCNEICAPLGFGWSRRLMLVHMGLNNPDLPAENKTFFQHFGAKYGYSPAAGEAAPGRVVEILNALSQQLEGEQQKGRRYFIGGQLSALDIYWAGFSHLIEPLPPELCPMLDDFRPLYANFDPAVAKAASASLMAHREFIYREHLGLPMDI